MSTSSRKSFQCWLYYWMVSLYPLHLPFCRAHDKGIHREFTVLWGFVFRSEPKCPLYEQNDNANIILLFTANWEFVVVDKGVGPKIKGLGFNPTPDKGQHLANVTLHAVSAYSVVMGTWWNDKCFWVANTTCIPVYDTGIVFSSRRRDRSILCSYIREGEGCI